MPTVTPVDDAYLPPACVVCVMIGVVFRVVPIRSLPPRPEGRDQTCVIAARSRAQYQLCFGGHWVVTNTGYARHSRHFWPSELWAYSANSVMLSHWDTDSRLCWHLRTVVDARIATRLLAAAGAQPRGEPTREGGIIVRTGDPDSPTFADCNTARMTVCDLGHWLLHLHEDEHREHALVSDDITRLILELMGLQTPHGCAARKTATTISPGSTVGRAHRRPAPDGADVDTHGGAPCPTSAARTPRMHS